MSRLHAAVQAHYLSAVLWLAFWLLVLLGGSAWAGQRWFIGVAQLSPTWRALWVLAGWFLAANLCTWHYWHADKRIAAQAGRARVPEALLLLLSLAGGLPAALGAMHLLRHKSSKRAFQWRLAGVGAVWVAALGVGLWGLLGGGGGADR